MGETVKITGGAYRGRVIETPGDGTHPMGAREKLALFNMIGSFLPEASVLDAYAGSGALGVEALSRGARFALFLDSDDKAVKTIKRNLGELGVPPSQGAALKANVLNITGDDRLIDAILRLTGSGIGGFDVIFADPPYNKYRPDMITVLTSMVADGGIIVASTPVEGPKIDGFMKIKERKYAAAHITVYQEGN